MRHDSDLGHVASVVKPFQIFSLWASHRLCDVSAQDYDSLVPVQAVIVDEIVGIHARLLHRKLVALEAVMPAHVSVEQICTVEQSKKVVERQIHKSSKPGARFAADRIRWHVCLCRRLPDDKHR